MPLVLHEDTDVFEHIESLGGRVLFLHGCNAQGVMGAGVAKIVRGNWPLVFDNYRDLCDDAPNRALLVGHAQFVEVNEDLIVVNAITQEFYGRRGGETYASVEAIDKALRDITGHLETLPEGLDSFDHYVTVPVGCGLGGLQWEEVREVFDKQPVMWQVCKL